MTGPIPIELVDVPLGELVLGYAGERVSFCWRPYEFRTPDHQADYDRLIVSVFHHGIQTPLITCRPPGRTDHVLIGMRRAEIGRRLGLETVRCARILEDVHDWHGSDLARLAALKQQLGSTTY
jgi:hypothetical protein